MAVSPVQFIQVMCWKSSMLVKLSAKERGKPGKHIAEIFVAVVDHNSKQSVASDQMSPRMRRVVVSGKGPTGYQGRMLWKGGYKGILESVRASLSLYRNVEAQVICPECLAWSSRRKTATLGWDSVVAHSTNGDPSIYCIHGHRVNTSLVCGTMIERKPAPAIDCSLGCSEILPSVVIVGVYDPVAKWIKYVGSGFIVDRNLGLIMTAGHVLFDMENGTPYTGKVVIGVLPGNDCKEEAVYRYFGDIIAHDIHNVDACVVRIRSRVNHDADDDELRRKDFTADQILREQLCSL
jgi:S1-C subfamily serine protease